MPQKTQVSCTIQVPTSMLKKNGIKLASSLQRIDARVFVSDKAKKNLIMHI
jgi:hypothetical protein